MPTIPYQCKKCDHYFETNQGYNDKRLKKCPECKKMGLKQVFCAPYITGEIKSLGSIAEKNTREMGKYHLEDSRRKDDMNKNAVKLQSLKELGVVKQDATEIPKAQNTLKDLREVIKSPEKVKKYIEEGKK